MESEVYKDMLGVMTKRGGPYADWTSLSSTPWSGTVHSEEAELNQCDASKPVTAAEIAKEKGRDEADVTALFEGMANKGLCVAFRSEGKTYYQAAAFMPGIFEFQFMGAKPLGEKKRLPGSSTSTSRPTTPSRAPADFLPIEPRHPP